MDILILLIPAALGIVTGILIGLLPGLGASATMLMLYPVLFQFDIISLFVFYIALINSTQYYGSVSAIVFGVTGEVSSLPAVKHGHSLFRSGLGKESLIYTSTGSFFASIIALVMFGAISLILSEFFVLMLKGSVILSLLAVAFLIIVATSEKPLLAIIYGILGIILSQVGYDDLHNVRFLTFGTTMLEGGLPIFPIFCGLIIIPLLLQYGRNHSVVSSENTVVKLKTRVRLLFDLTYLPSIFRGSFIGFIVGLIPGCSYTVSSNIADSIEGKVVKSETDETKKSMKRLISAESANNAGSVSVLIPLITMAIPIVFSEAILLGILETKGFDYSVSIEFFTSYFWTLMLVIITVNAVNWVLAGLLFNAIIIMYVRMQKIIYPLVAVLCLLLMAYIAVNDSQFLLSAFTFVVALLLGLVTTNESSKFVLIYTFFVATIMLDEFYRIFLI